LKKKKKDDDMKDFWRIFYLHFDSLKEAIELEYVMKLYVDTILSASGKLTDLYDWQNVRKDRFTLHNKVSDYIVENILFDKPEDFTKVMNPVYLNDFKHIFYAVIFTVEFIKYQPSSKQSFPCTISQLQDATDCMWSPLLRDRLCRDIGKLREVIELLIEDREAAQDVLNQASARDHINELKKLKKEKAWSWFHPLEDNLIFLLPFIAVKILSYPITARAFIDIILEHPRESMVNTTSEDYKDLKSDLYPQFLTFKLSITPYRLAQYQRRFITFVFDGNDRLHKAFSDLYVDTPVDLDYPADFYIKLMRYVMNQFRIPKSLFGVANHIFCGLMASHPEFVSDKEECVCLGVCYFLLKAFYGLGLNAPSLVTITKTQVSSQVEDADHRAKLQACLDFIAKFETDCKLHAISKSLPPFEMLLKEWFELYRGIKRHNDEYCVMPQTGEDMSNLTLQQTLSLIDVLGGALLSGIKNPKITIIDKPKSKERGKRGPNIIKVDVSYPDRCGSYILKDEVKQEMDFILRCSTEVEDLKAVQLPHPSDVYVKLFNPGSIPIDKFTEDILIVYELFTVFAAQHKDLVMPILEKSEKLILQMLKD
jgi:PHB de-polymerase C-terminus